MTASDPLASRTGAGASAVPGRGGLAVVRGCGGPSVVTRAYATSPLRLLMPKNHGSAAWVYTSSYGGGLVDGDRIALDVDVGPGAAAFLSTQASTKVYRSPQRHEQRAARAHLDGGTPGGHARPGRLLRGARATGRRSRSTCRRTAGSCSSTGCRRAGTPPVSGGRSTSTSRGCARESRADSSSTMRWRCAADDGDLRDRMGRFDVLAVVLILGTRLRDRAAEIAARVAEMPVPPPARAARGGDAGWRIAAACCASPGRRSSRRRGRSAEYLGFLPGLLGDDPWARKW